MAIVYLVSFCFLAIPSLFFLVFFLYFSGSIFFGTDVIIVKCGKEEKNFLAQTILCKDKGWRLLGRLLGHKMR